MYRGVFVSQTNLAGEAGVRSCPEVQTIVEEIARRRRAVVLPLFWTSFTLFVLTLIALAYLPEAVGYSISGSINLAYALALSQFAITFAVASGYSYWAKYALDPLTAEARELLFAEEQRTA